jgi:small subunit ribosomal protein S4
VGEKLFLKGERCFTPHCAIERRRRAPGEHPPTRRRLSDYALRLREKQKARFTYGLRERQFDRSMVQARRQPGITGQYLLQLLERRLDNVVFRLNFADSRRQARQLVLHGHITVNSHKVDVPSFILRAGDTVGWRELDTKKDFFKAQTEGLPKRPVPTWLSLDAAAKTGKVLTVPQPADVDLRLDTRLIVEFYSR